MLLSRGGVAVVVLVCGCGSAPPKPVIQSKRSIMMSLKTDAGKATAFVNGEERLHSATSRGANIALDLRPGDHAMVITARSEEYGGMGLSTDLTTERSNLIDLDCEQPCTDEKLGAWGTALENDPSRLVHPCSGIELRGLTWKKDGANIEIRFTLHVDPPLTAEDLIARNCNAAASPKPAPAAASQPVQPDAAPGDLAPLPE